MRILYFILLLLIFPFLLAVVAFRGWRQTGDTGMVRERLGYIDKSPAGPVIWVHAASVGEMQAALPLVKRLQQDYPKAHLLVTAFTASGEKRAQAAFGETVQTAALPYDLPRFNRRFLNRARPIALIVMETEVWPNLFQQVGARNIPIFLASARITERSLRRYQWVGTLLRDALNCVSFVAAQSAADAERFLQLGVPANRIKVVGNLKFDVPESAELIEQGHAIRNLLFGGAPVLIAASTRVGEDEIVLDAFQKVRMQEPDTRLIIVPRHPERGSSIRSMAESVGLSTEQRSRSVEPSNIDVYIVDTIGELNAFYAAADAAFVGGSLVDAGGHNLLEPASMGLPVLTGPMHSSSPDIFAAMRKADAVLVVKDADELAQHWLQLIKNPSQRDRLGLKAKEIVVANRGTLEAISKALTAYLHPAD